MSGTGTPFVNSNDGRGNINVSLTNNAITRPFQIAPGYCAMFAYGTWASATLKLQISPDKVKWFDFWSVTADGYQIDKRMGSFYARWYLSGGDGTTAVTVAFISS